MVYDYSKLRGRIREVLKTETAFAEAMTLATTSVSKKLNGHIEFTQGEILKAAEILGIDLVDIPIYFFNSNVQKTELY